jgi:hypothetical protein
MALLHVVNRCYCKVVKATRFSKKKRWQQQGGRVGHCPPWATLGSACGWTENHEVDLLSLIKSSSENVYHSITLSR